MNNENELIAEFMGLPLTIQEPEFSGDRKLKTVPFQRWRYDTSWDWLMPVWNKFASLQFEENRQFTEHADHCTLIAEKILEVDVFQAHERLVNGIKWYNSHKQ